MEFEISALSVGIGCSSTPSLTNETDLRRDLVDFVEKCNASGFSEMR